MPTVTYVDAAGTVTTVEVPVGDSVMDGALDHGIRGILGRCGGGCTCSTCHCYVAENWRDRLPPPGDDERTMLEHMTETGPGSRLACQITITDALDGLVVVLPERQLP